MCAAFEELKQYLSHPHILARLENEEVLYAYIAIIDHAVSLVLVRTENGMQRPVYYIRKSLQEAKTCYLHLEKVVLAIVHATRKLPYYFQAHTIMVLTQLPLQALLWKLDYTRRIAKWGTMLGAFDIKYLPRTAVKGQILADFTAEFTEDVMEDKEFVLGTLVELVTSPTT